MKKLRTRFSVALGIVLLVATILPVLIIYLLGASDLVEVTYITESRVGRQQSGTPEPPLTPLAEPDFLTPPWIVERLSENGSLPIPRIDPITGEKVPIISFDPVSGRWAAEIPSGLQSLVFTSHVFKFRVDLPAWLALGSLPLISILIGILLSAFMSRSVTRPVSQLAEAAQAIGRRELGYRVEAKGSQELKDLAESFNRMAGQLEHAEISRRNLMADVAHELRTPLSVLDGNLRAILDGVHGLNEEEIALLYEQTRQLNRLVADLQELSLAEANQLSLNRQEVDIVRLVRETVAHFSLLSKEQGIQLTSELDDHLVHPSLDENRIRQVLHNLLSNAFRYTPRGGSITITAKRLVKDNGIEVTVTDTGVGISPEELSHIFNRFYRTKDTISRDQGGTGLGLAIVKAIVDAHGGVISAQSGGRGKGSTFTLRFPF